jgi:mannose-6-phosphate isomerase-like protein (cupin superfamily)
LYRDAFPFSFLVVVPELAVCAEFAIAAARRPTYSEMIYGTTLSRALIQNPGFSSLLGSGGAPVADIPSFKRFNLIEVARSFPDTAESMLLDTYLTDETAASSRVFRVYRETPAHYHEGSDEYLYVLSGKGTFWMGDPSNGAEFAPGNLLFFKRRIVHALPRMLEGPVVFLAIDTPRRDPKDIIFVNPADGTPETFIRGKEQPLY